MRTLWTKAPAYVAAYRRDHHHHRVRRSAGDGAALARGSAGAPNYEAPAVVDACVLPHGAMFGFITQNDELMRFRRIVRQSYRTAYQPKWKSAEISLVDFCKL